MVTELQMKCLSSSKSFGGYQKVYEHYSNSLLCTMKFGIYIPPEENEDEKFPVLFYLAGLTCSEQTTITLIGYQRFASKYKMIMVAPDTSPRNTNTPNEDAKWSYGTGASMYVNATQEPWNKHYQMYTYITEELYQLVQNSFPVLKDKISISGHSLGGHGAMLSVLLNPEKYKSVSAFGPVCNITNAITLKKGLTTLLGENMETLQKWDPTFLVKNYNGPEVEMLIYLGTDDEFIEKELMIENLIKATDESKGQKFRVKVVYKKGYDHGYHFVSTFIEDHFKYHYSKLSA